MRYSQFLLLYEIVLRFSTMKIAESINKEYSKE